MTKPEIITVTLIISAMDTLSNIRIEDLTRRQIRLSGGWINTPPKHEWRGFAIADYLFSAVIFVRQGNVLYWSKAETNWVRFPLQYSAEFKLEIVLTISSDGAANHADIWYSIHHGGTSIPWVLKSSAPLPEIMETRIVFSGESFTFVTIESEPASNLHGIFAAKQDIKSLRKGLWRIKSEILEGIPEPSKSILGYGRHGKLLRAEN